VTCLKVYVAYNHSDGFASIIWRIVCYFIVILKYLIFFLFLYLQLQSISSWYWYNILQTVWIKRT
jgi:hypothetical protein